MRTKVVNQEKKQTFPVPKSIVILFVDGAAMLVNGLNVFNSEDYCDAHYDSEAGTITLLDEAMLSVDYTQYMVMYQGEE